jgi:hypothetical protein
MPFAPLFMSILATKVGTQQPSTITKGFVVLRLRGSFPWI